MKVYVLQKGLKLRIFLILYSYCITVFGEKKNGIGDILRRLHYFGTLPTVR
jgi:hypothetical protein